MKRAEEGAMPGPTKPYDEKKVGDQLQANYVFLEKLFGTQQKAFRDRFFRCATEAKLRSALSREKIKVPSDVRIMLVDVEFARMKTFGSVNPRRDKFYILVMPPVPRRERTEDYKEMQAWQGAWYHAIVDGYGM
jgi:hypothetical protein